MPMMNISLPDSLKALIDEQVADRGDVTTSKYMRMLDELRDGSRLLRTTVQASDGTGSAGSSG